MESDMSEEVEMTPISPGEGGGLPPKVSPFGAASAVVSAPAAPVAPEPAAAPAAGASTIKLKPVIRKPMIRKPTIGGAKPPLPSMSATSAPAAAAEGAAAPKKATQNLKSVTAPIPAQATLRKTGIIAEGIITPAQQQAAKSKTSRISLESAIGVAPAKEGPAPLKTIRLRRPTDLKPTATESAAAPAPAVAPLPATAPAAGDAGAGETQKKTLKLQRPGVGIKKPSLGLAKKEEPTAAQPTTDVQDIPDLPMGDVAPLTPTSDKAQCAGVPKWVATLSLVVTFAALLAVGALIYFFYTEGCGPDAGANAMPFITTGA
jgi:hypothetical protein